MAPRKYFRVSEDVDDRVEMSGSSCRRRAVGDITVYAIEEVGGRICTLCGLTRVVMRFSFGNVSWL